MGDKQLIGISVHALLDLTVKSGNLFDGFMPAAAMHEGAEEHRAVQRERKTQYPGDGTEAEAAYAAEVMLSYVREYEYFCLEVSGRADGIIRTDAGVVIEEIKTFSGTDSPSANGGEPIHWAQAKCYAAMLCEKEGLDGAVVRLTYRERRGGGMETIEAALTREELSSFFLSLLDRYAEWTRFVLLKTRDECDSLESLVFPFDGFRDGQRNMAGAVYRTVRDGRRIFIQAPTGTGKTIAVLYPALRALGRGLTAKLFYLTAKTVTRQAAENVVLLLKNRGMKLSSITLTAKEKICFRGAGNLSGGDPQENAAWRCESETCPYALGYFDRIDAAVRDILSDPRHLGREVVEEYALKHTVCPFELSLDASLWCGLIVCDYNYLFDPRAQLKRYFQDAGGNFAFLIDEAHNLPERARDMYSAELSKRTVLDLKKRLKTSHPAQARILSELNSYLIRIRKARTGTGEERAATSRVLPEDLIGLLEDWMGSVEGPAGIGVLNIREALDFTFAASGFLRTAESFGPNYVTITDATGGDVRVKLFCLDPSELLERALAKGTSAVFFSATLQPTEYFVRILGTGSEPETLLLPSPFPKENLKVFLEPSVSTRWAHREKSFSYVAGLISETVRNHAGNYLAFFPSFAYMEAVAGEFASLTRDIPLVTILLQNRKMNESEREVFLNRFQAGNDGALVGFAVMGGIFGEGIDLAGERLCGAIIVGVGLPQVNVEREAIRTYFDETTGNGFAFSYMYPGINRVLQAAGRVIRSETDRGIILLIDDRFSTDTYSRLLPGEWKPVEKVHERKQLSAKLERFWRKDRV